MMKNKGISWLIYCIMAVLCAFSLGWVLGSGGTHETVTVQVSSQPQETQESPASQETQTPEAPQETQEEAPLELEEAEQQTQLSAPTEEAPLNLNTATQAELELLPGIGPVLAQAILDYRDSFGGFSAKEQLKEVSGIGEKRYAAVEALITVEVEDEGTGGR